MKIKKHLNVYKALIKLNFSVITAYRVGFYSLLIDAASWAIFQYIWIILMTTKVKSVYGWTRNELIILVAAYSFFWGIFHFVFARNFNHIPVIIEYGDLDTILVKPIDSQFLLSLKTINFAGLFRTILGLIILIYMLNVTHITLTIVNIASFLALGVFGMLLIYSFWFITATFLIWNPQLSNLINLLYNLTGITRLPPQVVYETKNYLLFFLIPLTIVISTPTKALLHKVLLGDVIVLLFASVTIFMISRIFWRFALRHYTSASS
jgi:ABC-2 type transport system permease protein